MQGCIRNIILFHSDFSLVKAYHQDRVHVVMAKLEKRVILRITEYRLNYHKRNGFYKHVKELCQ